MAIEALARVPARAEIASEFRHRHPIVPRDALFLAIGQSGETADTLGAVQEIQLYGEVMGVVNVVGYHRSHLRPRRLPASAPRWQSHPPRRSRRR